MRRPLDPVFVFFHDQLMQVFNQVRGHVEDIRDQIGSSIQVAIILCHGLEVGGWVLLRRESLLAPDAPARFGWGLEIRWMRWGPLPLVPHVRHQW